MSKNRLEDLWNSADDGASAPIGTLANRPESDFDELLDAWFLERRNSIEFEMLLDESRRLIERLIAEADLSTSGRRRARRLLRTIKQTLRGAKDEQD